MALMSLTAHADAAPLLRVEAPRIYRFTDDAVSDAMVLIAVLAQHGIAADDAEGPILEAKRTLGSDDWDRSAEQHFWCAYASVAGCFRARHDLEDSMPRVLERNRGVVSPALDLFATPWRYCFRIIYLLAFIAALVHWVDGKLLADRMDALQDHVIACLEAESQSTAPLQVGGGPPGAPSPAALAAYKTQLRDATRHCDPLLQIVSRLVMRAECFLQVGCWSSPRAGHPGEPSFGADEEALWDLDFHMMLGKKTYSLPAAVALGQHVQAFAVYVLPFLFGSLGAYVSSIYRQLGRPWLEIFPNRVSLRRRIIMVFCGGIFGALVGWLLSEVSVVPSLLQSLGPLFGAFAAGFNTRPVVKCVDALADRIGDWGTRILRGDAAAKPQA